MPIKLLWRNLLSHPIRALLTVASVTVAVFLLCVLDAANRGLDAAVSTAATSRLWVQSAVSLFVSLPQSYQSKLEAVPGVDRVIRFQWFGGVYREPSNFFGQFGVDADKWLQSYPEVEVEAGAAAAWQRDRVGCIVGADLARRFDWKVGDHVPLIGTIFPRADGAAWDFTIDGIYRSKSVNIDQASMFFHYEYLRQGLEQGDVLGPEGVGVYLLALAAGADRDAAIATVDDLYANGPQRVRTITEAEFQRQFVTMLGSVPTLLASVGGGVLFAIFFAVLNTMLMAARERTRDLGILKALGFANGTIGMLLLGESLLLCSLGGLLGAALAQLADRPLWSVMSTMIPGFSISGAVVMQGIALAALLGLVAGTVPALRARRLQPVAALRLEV